MISAPSQVVNVKVDASSHFSAEINSKLDVALDYLKSKYIEKRELSELEDKINILKQELSKSNPNKSKLKSILKWSLDKGLDIFVKLAPPVIEKISRLI
jgi:predicted RNase H-like nuclease (RuvC/YqgF family)